MASIQLSRYEAEEDDLPDICMRCGSPTTVRKRFRFTSHPLWVYLFLPFGIVPYVVLAALLTEKARCYTHFCDRHKNHWRVRALAVWGGLGVIFSLVAILIGYITLVGSRGNEASDTLWHKLAGIACFAVPALLFCWIISIPIIQLTAIHLSNVTEKRLTLRSVSPEFVEAVHVHREKRDAVDEQDLRGKFRPRRHPDSGQDIYDPER